MKSKCDVRVLELLDTIDYSCADYRVLLIYGNRDVEVVMNVCIDRTIFFDAVDFEDMQILLACREDIEKVVEKLVKQLKQEHLKRNIDKIKQELLSRLQQRA